MEWDLVGHQWAVHLLQGHLVKKAMRHAYLFTGPDGVGRRTLALRFVQAMNCPSPLVPGQPCRACRTCRQIEEMQFPDLVVTTTDESGSLKVDQVRELQHGLALSPYQAEYKVALLLDFQDATPSASNALLKTLEEPPPQVVMILTADSVEALLPTIVSRCEVLRLRPLPVEQVQAWLVEKAGLEVDQAALLAHLSGGRPGDAWRLFEHPERVAQHRQYLDDLHTLLGSSLVERFAYAEALAKDKATMRQVLQVWLSYWRDVLLSVTGASAPYANLDRASEIEKLGGRFSLSVVRQVITQLDRIRVMLDANVNPKLAAEVLLLDLPRV